MNAKRFGAGILLIELFFTFSLGKTGFVYSQGQALRRVKSDATKKYKPGMIKSLEHLLAVVKPGQRVVVRGDIDIIRKGKLEDDSGRKEALEKTLGALLRKGAFVILVGHNGRPGLKDLAKDKAEFSVEALAGILTEDLRAQGFLTSDEKVEWSDKAIGSETKQRLIAIAQRAGHKIALLENLRFDGRENTENEAARLEFAGDLQNTIQADHFVNEAFASSARMNASTLELPILIPGLHVAGFQLIKELDVAGEIRANPKRPMIAVFGGAKLDKLPSIVEWVAQGVLVKGDTLYIGGFIGLYVMEAMGLPVGSVKLDDTKSKDAARKIVDLAKAKKVNLVVPQDATIQSISNPNDVRENVALANIPTGYRIVDIGEKTIIEVSSLIDKAETRFWNGVQGMYDYRDDPRLAYIFSKGTAAFLKQIATKPDAINVAAGGDGLTSAKLFLGEDGAGQVFRVLATGGGAFLEFMANLWLPALDPLDRN